MSDEVNLSELPQPDWRPFDFSWLGDPIEEVYADFSTAREKAEWYKPSERFETPAE